jgi:hypothetical protein
VVHRIELRERLSEYGIAERKIMPRSETMQRDYLASDSLPVRKGPRPKTIVGPLHIQCNRHGDPKHLYELVKDVLTWPHIESMPSFVNRHIVRVRLEKKAARSDTATFISDREFARFLLAAPTIYLALPLPLARRAIARRWAEPHYLQSFGLMPAGTVVVYTPENREELAVCYSLFSEAYRFACKFDRRRGVWA